MYCTVFCFLILFCYVGCANTKVCSTGTVDVNCEPICDPPCQNGYCEAPQQCKCSKGYTKSSKGFCESTCSSSSCINGTCISPTICQCKPGFTMANSSDGSEACVPNCKSGYEYKDGLCRPKCHHSCGKGTCISPNVCECFRGYKIDIKKIVQADSQGDLCIPSCKQCAGECVAPNTCITTTTVTTPPTYISIQPDPTTVRSLTTSQITSINPTTFGSTTSSVNAESSSSRLTTWSIRPTTISSPVFHSSTTNTTIAPDSTTITDVTSPSTNMVYTDWILTAVTNGTRSAKIAASISPEYARRHGEGTWIEQHWNSLLLAILLLISAVIVVFIAWRLKPFISYFRGRSYYIPGEPVQYSTGTNNV